MKHCNPTPDPARTATSGRSLLALATLMGVGGTAATAQSVTEAATTDDAAPESGTLPELVLQEAAQDAYNPQNLSSQKFTAPLLDTPQTFTVIPKEVYNQQNARNLTDVLKNTPGISFNAGENGFASGMADFSMRGVDTAGSIFIDDVRDSGNYLRDVFNIERVEVVKGPAADNGRGTAGGYLNLVTKTPQLEDFITGSTSFRADEHGGNGSFRNTLDVNQNVSGSGVPGTAFRLNALLQEGGVAGRDWAENNAWGVAPSLTFGLGTPTRLTFAYQHVEQNDLPDWGIPTGVSSPGGSRTGFVSEGGRGRRDVFYGLRSDYDDVVSDSLLFRFEHDFANGMQLTNQTRWARTDRDARYTLPTGFVAGDFSQVTTQTQGYARENVSWSNLTNLSHVFETGGLKHTISAGLELSRETSDAGRFGTADAGTVSTTNPNPNRIPAPVLADGGNSEVTIDTIAAYLYDTVEFSPQWQLTGGLRVEHYRLDLENNPIPADASALPSYRTNETTVGGKLGLVYKPEENGSIYASAGISAIPPGAFLSNPDISRSGNNAFPGASDGLNSPDAKTRRNINYEVGTKWNFFGDRLTTTAALFRTEQENIRLVGAGGDISYGEHVIQGLELGAAGQLTDEWAIFGGVLLMDTERRNGTSFDNRPGAGTDPGSDGGAVDGDQLAFAPNYTANLWTTYRLPIGLTLGGGLQYVSSSYIGRPDDAERAIENGHYGKLPDYLVINAMAAYEVNDHVTLRLNIDNVFDEVYAVSSNWNGARSQLGVPRTFTISADWKF